MSRFLSVNSIASWYAVRIVLGEGYREIEDKDDRVLKRLKSIDAEKLGGEICEVVHNRDKGELVRLDTTEIIRQDVGLPNVKELSTLEELEEKTLIKCYRDDSTF